MQPRRLRSTRDILLIGLWELRSHCLLLRHLVQCFVLLEFRAVGHWRRMQGRRVIMECLRPLQGLVGVWPHQTTKIALSLFVEWQTQIFRCCRRSEISRLLEDNKRELWCVIAGNVPVRYTRTKGVML